MAAMAPYVAGFSDDGRGVQSEAHDAPCHGSRARGCGKLIVAHCEDNVPASTGGYIHDGALRPQRHGHPGHLLRERVGADRAGPASWRSETGCRYHVCHISTKESVALIRQAKAEGRGRDLRDRRPTICCSDEDHLQEDGRFKMNPPLRSPRRPGGPAGGPRRRHHRHDRHRSRPPQRRGEVPRAWRRAPWASWGWRPPSRCCIRYLVKPGLLSLDRLMELLHDAPCRRFGLPQGEMDGPHADLTVFDLYGLVSHRPGGLPLSGRRPPPSPAGRYRPAAC